MKRKNNPKISLELKLGQQRENQGFHPFKAHGLSHRNGRSLVYKPFRLFRHVLHYKKLIWEHSNSGIRFIFINL